MCTFWLKQDCVPVHVCCHLGCNCGTMKVEKWNPIKITRELAVSGGRLKKDDKILMDTVDIQIGEQMFKFVRVDKGQKWIIKSIGGSSCQRSTFFNQWSVFDDIGRKLQDLNRMLDADHDSGDTSSGGNDSQDGLLLEIDTLEAAPPAKKQRKQNYISKRNKDQMSEIVMPRYSPVAYPENKETCTITVYATGTRALYLGIEHVDWLVEFLRDESDALAKKAQADDDDDAAPEDDQNHAHVPQGVSVKWCFKTHRWQAVILQTGQPFFCKVGDLTSQLWDQLSHIHQYPVNYEAANTEQRREVARLHLCSVMQCKLKALNVK